MTILEILKAASDCGVTDMVLSEAGWESLNAQLAKDTNGRSMVPFSREKYNVMLWDDKQFPKVRQRRMETEAAFAKFKTVDDVRFFLDSERIRFEQARDMEGREKHYELAHKFDDRAEYLSHLYFVIGRYQEGE